NARSISRGKRACAGSLQFTLFDRDAFYGLFLDESHFYYAHADEVNYLTNPQNISAFTGLFFQGGFGGVNPVPTDSLGVGGLDARGGVNRGINFGSTAGDLGTAPVIGTAGPQTNALQAAGGQVGALSVRRAAQHADQ